MLDGTRSTENSISATGSSPALSDDLLFEKNLSHLPWILYHILECRLSNPLPLRIMFSFNAGMIWVITVHIY